MATSRMVEQACRPDSSFVSSPQLLKGAEAVLHGADVPLPAVTLIDAREVLAGPLAGRHDCNARKARPATDTTPARPGRRCTRPGHAEDAAALRLAIEALELDPAPPAPVRHIPLRPTTQAAPLSLDALRWMDRASCRGEDVVLFYGPDGERLPEREVREDKAKAVCSRCPVRYRCLDYAVDLPEKYGIWGGMNADEIQAERRRRGRRASEAKKRAERDADDLAAEVAS